MAINAYTGLMGSGKSYEVVENVILPALLAGRRVVTNVANLQQEDISAYLVDKFSADPDKLGQIVQVLNEDLLKPEFFPVEVETGKVAMPSIVQPGDLVVVDECWRWWATGSKITPAHMTFFRMHRHFVNTTTQATCDIVLVCQDIGDLDRKLKVVVENTYRMSKHKSLGSSTRYRVDLYASYKTTKAPYRSLQRKYNKEIFSLYQSYSQGSGKSGNEVAIDDRANIFNGLFLKFVFPIAVLVFGFAFWLIWGFFHPKSASVAPVVGASAPIAGAGAIPFSRGTGGTGGTAGASSASTRPVESEWRVVGDYRFDGKHYVIISRSGLLRTLINPYGFYYDSLRASGSLNSETLSSYTGHDVESNSLIKK